VIKPGLSSLKNKLQTTRLSKQRGFFLVIPLAAGLTGAPMCGPNVLPAPSTMLQLIVQVVCGTSIFMQWKVHGGPRWRSGLSGDFPRGTALHQNPTSSGEDSSSSSSLQAGVYCWTEGLSCAFGINAICYEPSHVGVFPAREKQETQTKQAWKDSGAVVTPISLFSTFYFVFLASTLFFFFKVVLSISRKLGEHVR